MFQKVSDQNIVAPFASFCEQTSENNHTPAKPEKVLERTPIKKQTSLIAITIISSSAKKKTNRLQRVGYTGVSSNSKRAQAELGKVYGAKKFCDIGDHNL